MPWDWLSDAAGSAWDAGSEFLGSDLGQNLLGGALGAWDAYSAGQERTGTSPYLLPGQEDAYRTGFGAAQDIWNMGPTEYYPNSTVAPRTQPTITGEREQLHARPDLRNLADMGYGATAGLAAGGAPRIAGFQLPDQVGFGLPQEYQDAIMNPIWRELNDQVLPGIESAAGAAGAYGGSRQGVAVGDATERASTAATEALIRGNLAARDQSIRQRSDDIGAVLEGRGQDIDQNSLYNDALRSGVDAVSASQAQQLVPGQVARDIGGVRDMYQQARLTDDVNRWNFDQNSEQNLLSNYFGWLSGAPAYSGAYRPDNSGTDWLDILRGGLQGSNMTNLLRGTDWNPDA